jgi:TatA/E family protein of Tat protein translocase
MLNINAWEFIILVVLFILVFGPDRLPETMVQMGKILREIRRAADEATGDLTRELEAAAREIKEAESEIKGVGTSARKALTNTARAPTATPETDSDEEPSSDQQSREE